MRTSLLQLLFVCLQPIHAHAAQVAEGGGNAVEGVAAVAVVLLDGITLDAEVAAKIEDGSPIQIPLAHGGEADGASLHRFLALADGEVLEVNVVEAVLIFGEKIHDVLTARVDPMGVGDDLHAVGVAFREQDLNARGVAEANELKGVEMVEHADTVPR